MAAPVDVVVLNNLGGGQSVQVDHLPRSGETVKGYGWRPNIDAGKGPNSCIAMGRLGIRPAFIGKAGRDPAGDRGEKWMQEAGVDTSGLLRTDEVMTGQGIRVIDKDGNNLIVCGESSSRALTEEEVLRELRRLRAARFFSTGFEIREELTLAAAREAKALGMTTVLNYSPLPPAPTGRLDYIDYLVVNEVEGSALAGVEDWQSQSLPEFLACIRDTCGCGCVIVTLGKAGSAGLCGGRFWRIPPVEVETIDTCGAGDAFLSAMIVNLVWGKDVEEACRWAGRYAAYTVTQTGTIPAYPTLEQFQSWEG